MSYLLLLFQAQLRKIETAHEADYRACILSYFNLLFRNKRKSAAYCNIHLPQSLLRRFPTTLCPQSTPTASSSLNLSADQLSASTSAQSLDLAKRLLNVPLMPSSLYVQQSPANISRLVQFQYLSMVLGDMVGAEKPDREWQEEDFREHVYILPLFQRLQVATTPNLPSLIPFCTFSGHSRPQACATGSRQACQASSHPVVLIGIHRFTRYVIEVP